MVSAHTSTDKHKLVWGAADYATHLFRLRPRSIALAERVGSAEPYGIDEAHDLFGGCEGDSERGGFFMLRRELALGAITALLVGCTADKPAPTGFEVRAPLFAVGGNSGGNGDVNLGTHMTGAEEVFMPVPPSTATPADSRAQGEAIFRVNGDGTSVDFRLIASNIDNVIMSHIHCGLAGANGPIRMWLYPVVGPAGAPAASGAGPQNGVLASGTFNPTGVTCPDGSPLLDAIRAGRTYVNVHTKSHDLPANTNNTGPGDFPGGEIRGQLDDHNH